MEQVMHIEVNKSEKRGVTKNDWLFSRHSFSFGQYFDSNRLNFGTLRVVNEDIVEPGKGFETHTHDNMEIVTIVLDGVLEHKDSLGTHGVIKTGDVQRMSAGKGIRHSEFNGSDTERVHFLQIWIYPEKRDLEPSYEQKSFPPELFKNVFVPIVKKISSETSLSLNQDAYFYLGDFDGNQTISFRPVSKRHGIFLFIIKGEALIGDQRLKKKDSAEISKIDVIDIRTKKKTKILLIEVGINTL